MESRVELFGRIRRDARVEGLPVRALAVRPGVHRRAVRQRLESAAPPERKPRRGVFWRPEPFKPAIDAEADRGVDRPTMRSLPPIGSPAMMATGRVRGR